MTNATQHAAPWTALLSLLLLVHTTVLTNAMELPDYTMQVNTSGIDDERAAFEFSQLSILHLIPRSALLPQEHSDHQGSSHLTASSLHAPSRHDIGSGSSGASGGLPPISLPACMSGLSMPQYIALFSLSGLYPGNLGDYDGCMHANGTQYFLLSAIALSSTTKKAATPPFKMAVCLPHACSTKDADQLVYVDLNPAIEPIASVILYPAGETIAGNQAAPWRASNIAAVSFCVILIIITLTAGAYHTMLDHECAEANLPPPTEDSWPIGMRMLMAFSFRRNWRSFWRLRPTKAGLDHLDGIRALSMLWVVFGHVIYYALTAGGLKFYQELVRKLQNFSYQLLPAAFFSVDSFFYLSGLLTTRALMKQMPKMKFHLMYPLYVFSRFLRLTVLLAFVIMLMQHVLPMVGHGPLWSQAVSIVGDCSTTWWYTLLYIQNFTTSKGFCLGHTWYLAPDMQLYLAAPFVVGVYLWNKIAGFVTIAVLTCTSTAINIYLVIHYGFTASPLSDIDYFNVLYIKPYTRAQPWLMGILGAYILNYLDNHKKRWTRSASSQMKTVILLLWGVIGATLLACTFGTLTLYKDPLKPKWTVFENVAYVSFSRLAWGLALMGITCLCSTGWGGYVDRILNRELWQILAKLTYASYLIHPLILSTVYMSSKDWISYSDPWVAVTYTAMVMWVTLIAFLLWMVVEKPAANLSMLLLGSFKKPPRREEGMARVQNADDDEKDAPLLANEGSSAAKDVI